MNTHATLTIITADITRLSTGAIVNPANSNLWRGGGCCGAIFDAVEERGGCDQLVTACRSLGHCDTGDAVITPSFGLDSPYIIHAVGPVWPGIPHVMPPSLSPERRRALEDLASTYRALLRVCRENGITSVAVPAISTGIYGVPNELGAAIAVAVCSAEAGDIEVTLVAYDEENRLVLASAPSPDVAALLG
jgi:O-acetyl-ADP-ribose deacetylase (regulator of RNase III)